MEWRKKTATWIVKLFRTRSPVSTQMHGDADEQLRRKVALFRPDGEDAQPCVYYIRCVAHHCRRGKRRRESDARHGSEFVARRRHRAARGVTVVDREQRHSDRPV